MIKKYIYSIMIGAFVLLSFSGCNDEVAVPEGGEQVPISFVASIPTINVESGTRAAGLSKNDKVAIVAANATATSPVPTNWTTGLYLDHVTGTVGDPTWAHADPDPEYPITLTPTRYWPFAPNNYLGFVAYSPIPESNTRVVRSDMYLTVTGEGTDFFPDLLYTGKIGNYNKTDKRVLFNFQHAMARLAVNVIVVDKDDNVLDPGKHPVNQLKISSLVVNTKALQGVFDLVSSGWTLASFAQNFQPAYTLASQSKLVALPYDNRATSECYLLPSTEKVDAVSGVSINFKVKDTNTNLEVGGDYPLANFKDNGNPVKLEMGKTTVLTIKIIYVSIPDPDPNIILEGQLKEWEYKGKSEVVIE